MEVLDGVGDIREGEELLCSRVRYKITVDQGRSGLGRIAGTLRESDQGGHIFKAIERHAKLTLLLRDGQLLDFAFLSYNPADDTARISGAGQGFYRVGKA